MKIIIHKPPRTSNKGSADITSWHGTPFLRATLPLFFMWALAACSGGDDPAAPGPGAPDPVADLEVLAGTNATVTLGWTVPGASVVYDLRTIRLGEESADRALWTVAPAPMAVTVAGGGLFAANVGAVFENLQVYDNRSDDKGAGRRLRNLRR